MIGIPPVLGVRIGRVARVMDKATAEAFRMERDSMLERLTQEEQSAARELQSALPDWRQSKGGLGPKFVEASLYTVTAAAGVPEKLTVAPAACAGANKINAEGFVTFSPASPAMLVPPALVLPLSP